MKVIGFSGFHDGVRFKRQNLPGLSEREYRIAQGLDSAAAIVTNRGIEAAAAEERFNRIKGTGAFPIGALRFCLDSTGTDPRSVDLVAHSFDYEPIRSFYDQSDYYRRQFAEVYSAEALKQKIREHFPEWEDRLVCVPHHLAHAASAFDVSGFEDALVLVADGIGERHSLTIALAQGRELEVLRQVPELHSLGVLYGVFTMYLGFSMNLDEYKVMGLAPYGDPSRYFDEMMNFVRLKPKGEYSISVLFRNASIVDKESYRRTLRTFEDSLGPAREPGSEITQRHKDVAAALQSMLQACLLHVLWHFKHETRASNLCMAGGVALNCSANGVIHRSGMFRRIFVQPAAGDDGSALGAALHVHGRKSGCGPRERMPLPFWGPRFDSDDVCQVIAHSDSCVSRRYGSYDELVADVAERLSNGQIIAWFRGAMEFGPRALGNRSILADPRNPTMRNRLNSLVKKRESFRPFAPAVPSDVASRYFQMDSGDEGTFAHMLVVTHVREEFRSSLPAITHTDGSARVQTVDRDQHPCFWRLLRTFGEITGVPILLNTSFNVRSQPIVCTPSEALETFLSTDLDAMVIEDHLVIRA